MCDEAGSSHHEERGDFHILTLFACLSDPTSAVAQVVEVRAVLPFSSLLHSPFFFPSFLLPSFLPSFLPSRLPTIANEELLQRECFPSRSL